MSKKVLILILSVIAIVVSLASFLTWKYYLKSSKMAATTNANPFKTSADVPEENTKETKQDIPKVDQYSVPILMYHYIRDASGEDQLGKNLSVNPVNFDAHIKWLKEDGFQPVKLADLGDQEKNVISKVLFEKKKPIVITFDDGYLDAYTQAFPVLQKYDFFGTFFIIRNYVGKDNYMNESQINELKTAGMEIGSHSLSHPNLTSLDTASAQEQITDSKEDSNTFCYPAGKFNEQIANLVKEAGYLAAVTTQFGVADQNSDLFKLPRVRVEDGSAETLKLKIEAANE